MERLAHFAPTLSAWQPNPQSTTQFSLNSPTLFLTGVRAWFNLSWVDALTQKWK